MKPSTKKLLRTTGIIFGILVLIAGGFAMYLKSILPPTIGKPIVLQKELFLKPDRPYPMEGKYIYKSATELAAMIRHREATSVEIITEFLNNIKNNNYKYNAMIWLREKEALQDARQADESVLKGDTVRPLLGVPVTIKEHYWVTGSPSTMNAKMYGFTAPRDAQIVEQIRKSGAVILGTTNVPYMLSDYQTHGEVYPTASNPYDTSRTPGGSTGGGAAALAAGFTSLELGTDMGGSIRVPAAFCGLYGLKSTFNTLNIIDGSNPDTVGKYSRIAMACPGPLARTPEDLELFWNVLKDAKIDERRMKHTEWKPATEKKIADYHFAWMDEWQAGKEIMKMSTDVKEKLQQLLDSLKNDGASLEKKAPDTYNEMVQSFLGTFGCMMSENQPWLLRKLIAMDFNKLNPGSSNFDAFSESMNDASDARWLKVQTDTKTLQEKWVAFFKQTDFFICPITYGPAIKKCPSGSRISFEGNTLPYMYYFPYSYIINPIGLPALSIPMGLNKDGLPIGIQIVGPADSEPELLHLAKLIRPITPGFAIPVDR